MLNKDSDKNKAKKQSNRRVATRLKSWAAAYGVPVGELARYLLAVGLDMLEHGNLNGPSRRDDP